MLRRAGAEVIVLGFRRTHDAPSFDDAPVVDLGETFDGRLTQRGVKVVGQILRSPMLGPKLRGADVILARNLEMLLIAATARRLHARAARLAYECLDIHRLMVSTGWVGPLLRRLESTLLDDAQLLLVSSPAYVRSYFEAWQRLDDRPSPRVLLIENKVFGACPGPGPAPRPTGPPWRIGWFGMLRC